MAPTGEGFAEDLLRAPVGVAVLAALEQQQRPPHFDLPADADPDAVRRAAASIAHMDLGAFLALALDAAYRYAGPWTSDAPRQLAAAYADARARRPIAEAVADRFGAELHAAADLGPQEWWWSARRPGEVVGARAGRDLDAAYCCGEFSWGGLWTSTTAPPSVHDGQAVAWEIEPEPSRWRLPLRPGARVRHVDGPEDWTRLVREHPSARPPHWGWELPGPNRLDDGGRLEAASAGRAARARVGRNLLPAWSELAREVDGVHLSWAGFLTTEGHVIDLGDGAVTMLRYWGAERTHWFADVFGEPEPLPAPAVLDGADARHEPRRGQDLEVLRDLLGR